MSHTKYIRNTTILMLIVAWIFSGTPSIFNFPPKVKHAEAYTCLAGSPVNNDEGECIVFLTNTVDTSWSVPADWNDSNNSVAVIGGGGAAFVSSNGSGGGGGGAFASSSNLTLGASAPIQVGVGGTTGNGEATYFNDTNCLVTQSNCLHADFGDGATSGTGAAGGDLTNTFGTVEFVGGTGGTGNTGNPKTNGGGGGAGGPYGNGQNGGAGGTTKNQTGAGGGGGNGGGSAGSPGSGTTGGNGGNNAQGSGGGSGGSPPTAGSNGGGGGGGDGGANGANGGNGVEWGTHGSGGGGGGDGGGGTAGTAGLYGAGGAGGNSAAGDGGQGLIVIIYVPVVVLPPASLVQHSYRWFANTDSIAVGGAAGLNQPTSAPVQGTPFRLRMLLYNEGGTTISATTSELQFALRDSDGVCDGDETYSEVTSGTDIRYYNNGTPADGDDLSPNSFDPVASSSAVTVRTQDYEESNTFTNSVAAIAENEAGLWDFSLVDAAAPPGTIYCFRGVQDDSGTNFVYSGGYDVFPEITTAKELSVRLRGAIRLRTVRLR